MMVDYIVWGDMVRLARHRRKLTQRALADLVGVSSSLIGDIERGEAVNPSHTTVIAVCTALDIDEPPALTVERGEL